MSRLPVVGQDDDIWGEVLNDYLSVSHGADGTLKSAAVAGAIADGSVSGSKLSAGSVTNSKITDGTITEAKLDAGVQAKLAAGGGDPTMGGDLSGTAGNAQIVAGAVGSTELAAGSITDAKVAAGANIAQSKVANLTTDLSGKTDKATLTTKGDIYAAAAAANPTRLGVGGDGQVLTADSTQTAGLKWTTVDTSSIANDSIDNSKLADSAVDDSKIAPSAAIAQSKIANLTTDLSNKADNSSVVQKVIVDAKGDLIAATANDTVTRLGVGSDGEVLTADSSQSTGLKWSSLGTGYIQGDGIAKVTVGTTAPTSPAVGDVWIAT